MSARKIALHMMLTLDGCVSGPNGELDWLFAIEDEERGDYLLSLYSSVGGIIAGKETYKGCAAFWPSAAANPKGKEKDRAFARQMNALNKYVFSKTLDKVEWENSHLMTGDLAEEIQTLKNQPGNDLIIIGGHSLAQACAKQGLIDEYHLIVHPVVLGKGRRLFDSVEEKLSLKLLDAKPFKTGVVATHYAVTK
jgi:dihydrofolate reductase